MKVFSPRKLHDYCNAGMENLSAMEAPYLLTAVLLWEARWNTLPSLRERELSSLGNPCPLQYKNEYLSILEASWRLLTRHGKGKSTISPQKGGGLFSHRDGGRTSQPLELQASLPSLETSYVWLQIILKAHYKTTSDKRGFPLWIDMENLPSMEAPCPLTHRNEDPSITGSFIFPASANGEV